MKTTVRLTVSEHRLYLDRNKQQFESLLDTITMLKPNKERTKQCLVTVPDVIVFRCQSNGVNLSECIRETLRRLANDK